MAFMFDTMSLKFCSYHKFRPKMVTNTFEKINCNYGFVLDPFIWAPQPLTYKVFWLKVNKKCHPYFNFSWWVLIDG
jgi:hypothetical protein